MRTSWAQLSVLICVTLLVYAASLQNGYVYLDDTNYLINNELVTDFSVARMAELFSSVRGNFTPLTWLTHIAAWQLFGEAPTGHHALSLLLHLINIALVFFVTRFLWAAGTLKKIVGTGQQVTGFSPFFVALLFALHPQNVEAVCWIAARKDLLMCLFALLTTWLYLSASQRKSAMLHLSALGMFLLACLAKPTAVMLIVVLLIISLTAIRTAAPGAQAFRHAARDMLPFIAIGVLVSYFAYTAQLTAQAIGMPEFSLAERAMVVLKNLTSYYSRYFLLENLAVNYPLNKDFSWRVIAGLLGLVILTRGLVGRRFRSAALLCLCTVVMLLPSVGIVQYGIQATGDRFTYMAFIPMHIWLTAVVGAGLGLITELRVLRLAKLGIGLGLLLLAQMTYMQAAVWRNDLSLWAHGVDAQPDNPLAYQYLGGAFIRAGDYALAVESLEQSMALAENGVYMDTRSLYFDLGRAHYGLGDYAAAYPWFARLLNGDTRGFNRIGYAYYFVASILSHRNEPQEALRFVRESLRWVPEFSAAVQLNEELEARLKSGGT